MPDDDRLLKITCPSCQATFRVQNATIVSSGADSESEDTADIPSLSRNGFAVLILLAAIVGVFSASHFLVGPQKSIIGLFVVIVVLFVLYLVGLFIIMLLLSWQPKLYRGAYILLCFSAFTFFFHSLWYAHDQDDSRVEIPIVKAYQIFGLEHERSETSKALMVQARDALLEQDYKKANEALAALNKLYRGKPARFYYYRAFVYDALGETLASDLNAKWYLERVDVEGKNFAAADKEFKRRLLE